jgi:antitoxin HigA-1
LQAQEDDVGGQWNFDIVICILNNPEEKTLAAELGIPMKSPPRMGGFVKPEILAHLELAVTDAAKALGVTRPALSGLLNEHVDLSPEMALCIEMAFGVSIDDLMCMQNSYDIARARKGAKAIKV